MKTNNNIPAYRFQGYTDAWELRKLGEVAEIITGTTPSTFDEENYGGKRLFVSPVDIQDNRYITETLTTLTEKGHLLGRELRPGATLFVSIGSTIGKVAQLKAFATSNQQINAVISDDKIDDDFIFTGLEKKSTQIKNLSSQQAVPIINKSTFSKIEFEFPSLPEQEAIGTFFSTLDQHITLHQRKLDTLKEQKKSYLKLLFPAKGQTKPALRFQGFEDDWKEVKLGEVADIKTGSRDVQDAVENGEYPFFIRSEEVLKINTYSYDGEAILIPGEGRLGEIFHYVEGKFDYHQRVYKISDFKYCNALFILQIMRWNFKKHALKYTVKATVDSLRKPVIEDFTISLPTLSEQETIGTFFQTLDQEITQVEGKLTSLKEMKKTLLRKLFA